MPLLSETTAQPKDADHVESLERGLAVLLTLTAHDRALSISDLAESVGITRTAARRFALTLEHLGYVGQDAAGFSLKPRVLDIGDAYLRSNRLPAIAHPYLASLVEEIEESASLTVLHGGRVVYIDRVVAERVITANIVVGASVPAHLTATGRVLLSRLDDEVLDHYLKWLSESTGQEPSPVDPDEIRRLIADAGRQGWALADQELTSGIISIAVPVHEPAGGVVAALNVSAHASRATRQSLEEIALPLLQEAAGAVESELGAKESMSEEGDSHDRNLPPGPVVATGVGPVRPKDAVQSLERGLAILTAFDEKHRTMSLGEAAERCGLPRSVARRFLRTLVSLGYIETEGRRFGLTAGVLFLGYSHLSKLTFADIVRPYLETLSRELDASVSVGVLDGMDVRYVGRASAPSALAVSIKAGSRVPAHRTAMGRVLLASLSDERLSQYLAATEEALDKNRLDARDRKVLVEAIKQVRSEHWSYVDQLLEVGVRAISIPLRNRRNEVVAALSASVHEAETTESQMRNSFIPSMHTAAEAMTYEFRQGMET